MSNIPYPIYENESLVSVLNEFLEHIKVQLQADAGLILLRDPKTEMYQIVANTNRGSDSLGVVVRPDEDMVSRVAMTHQPMIVNKYRDWKGRSIELPDDGYANDALLCVPLLWEESYLGGLVVTAQSKYRKFVEQDISKLEIFSPIISALLKQCKPQDLQQNFKSRLDLEVEEEIVELRNARKKIAEDADNLRAILKDTVRMQEHERSRIANDLHDGSNQLIVGAIYEIQVTMQRLNNNRIIEAKKSLETVKSLLRRIEADIRMLISDLRPVTLYSRGLDAAFRVHLQKISETHGVIHNFQVHGTPIRLNTNIEVAIFRIVQEALNNAIEHANPHEIQIRLSFQKENLEVIVQDDGRGFDPHLPYANDNNHFGLISMRERALSIGARLDIYSNPDEGTRMVLQVPLFSNPEDPLGRLEQRHSVHVVYTHEKDDLTDD